MSSGLFCMLETKGEDKEEGEVSTELVQEEEVVQLEKEEEEEEEVVVQLEKDSKSSSKVLFSDSKVPLSASNQVPFSTSKPLLPAAPFPNLSSSCCDIPVVFGDTSKSDTKSDTSKSISKVILSAVSPWLASLIQGAEPGAGLSFPDLSDCHLSKYLSKCLSPETSLMAPEILDVHILLNPIKDVEPGPLVTNHIGTSLQTVIVEHNEPCPIRAANTSEKETTKENVASQEDVPVLETGIKAERTDGVREKYSSSDSSINIHSCGVCCKTFDNLHNLENHMVTHVRKSEDIQPCKECRKGFGNKNCQQHTKFPCNGCGKKFRNAHKSCSKHNNRIPGPPREKIFVCQECGKDYTGSHNRRKLFPAHARRCSVEKFTCQCPDPDARTKFEPSLSKAEAFKSYKRKARHIQVVHMGGFGCYETLKCYKTFQSEKDLKMHIAVVHKEEEGDFQCNQCGEQFNKVASHKELGIRRGRKKRKISLKELFEKHLWIHKVTDFECNCDNVMVLRPGEVMGLKGQRHSKIFEDKVKHMQVVHMGWNGCDRCDKRFKSSTLLEIHKEIHLQSTVCDQCGFKAKNERTLNVHKRREHESKSTECPKCNLVLKNEYHLRNHLRSACRVKSTCKVCGGKFRKIELHMRSMHTTEEDQKFHCSFCGKGFTSRRSFGTHEKNIHMSQKAFQCRYGCENRYNDQSNMFHHEKKHHGSSFKPAS